MKQLKLSFLLCFITIVTFAQTAQRGEQNPPAPGIGIVIKRNPGGGASKMVVTNEKGEATIKINEAGNYTLSLSQTQGKSAGEPIPGLTIKLGKNPGGNQFQVTTNEKGEAELKGLERGEYNLQVMQPAAAQASTDHIGHVTLIKKNGEKARTTMTTTSSTDYVGHVTLLRYSQLYFGTGFIMPSSTTKDGANSVNGLDFNIGYYHPIWAWEKSMISFGLNAEFGYNIGNGDRNLDQYTVYNVSGQSQLPTVSERGDKKPGQELGFRGAAGLQLNVHLGDKFTISPIINAGYLNITHKEFAVSETIYPQGNQFTYDLLTQKESKTSGLGVLPKLRMTYNISPRIGIWVEGNYTMGPKINTEVTTFAPEPSAGVDGTYTLSQFENGTYSTSKRETSYRAIGVSGGIVVSLGKPKGDKPTVGTLNPPLSTTTSGGTVANPQNLQNCPKGTYPNKCDGYGVCNPCLGCCPCFWLEEVNGKTIVHEDYCDNNGKIVKQEEYYDLKTGSINYFRYNQDFTIDNEDLNSVLGAKSFTIKKGLYSVDRSIQGIGGIIILDLANPIPINNKIIKEGKKFNGTYPKDVNCDGPGNTCFYDKKSNNKKDLQSFIMTPIIVGEFITKIKIQFDRGKDPAAPGF